MCDTPGYPACHNEQSAFALDDGFYDPLSRAAGAVPAPANGNYAGCFSDVFRYP